MYIPYKMADKCKQNIKKIITKILGSNFYFAHATPNILSILKDGELKIGTLSGEQNYHVGDKLEYAYAVIVHDKDNMNINAFGPSFTLLIDPRIIFDHDVIFNKRWSIDPITDRSDEENSIFLNKNDSDITRLYKLKLIRKITKKHKYSKYSYLLSHEFLFSKNIDMHKYLIGVIYHGSCSGSDSGYHPDFLAELDKIFEILKNNYNKVKVFKERCNNTNKLPTLIDLLC